MNKLAHSKGISDYITGYIKVADAKIGIYITLGTTASAIVSPKIFDWLSASPINSKFFILWALFVCAAMAFLATLFCTFRALSPRVESAESLVSFPDIAKIDPEEYADKFEAITEKGLLREYCKHNVTLSSIASKKFCWLGRATKFSYIWIVLYIGLYFMYCISAV